MDFKQMLKQQEELAASGSMFKQENKYESDQRFYKISKEQDGQGTVKIRFLGSKKEDNSNLNYFITRKVHNLKGMKSFPGKDKPEIRSFFGDNAVCPKTYNNNAYCPVCEYANKKYNEAKENGDKEKQTLFSSFFAKKEMITNIIVVSDKINKDNNGKVFLWKMPNTIRSVIETESGKVMDDINELTPSEKESRGIPEDLKGFDPYNLITSKTLTLKYKPKNMISDPKEYWGSSYFDSMFTSFVKTYNEWEEFVDQAYCLDEFLKKENCATPELLQEKLDWVLFKDTKNKNTVSNGSNESNKVKEEIAPKETESKQEEEKKEVKIKEPEKSQITDVDDFLDELGI